MKTSYRRKIPIIWVWTGLQSKYKFILINVQYYMTINATVTVHISMTLTYDVFLYGMRHEYITLFKLNLWQKLKCHHFNWWSLGDLPCAKFKYFSYLNHRGTSTKKLNNIIFYSNERLFKNIPKFNNCVLLPRMLQIINLLLYLLGVSLYCTLSKCTNFINCITYIVE